MGSVWLADQDSPVRRQVALKIIKPGMDSTQFVARFEAERQALALMDHANIAKVHDAGTTELGRPYFVMELVKGTPITEYCDSERLSPRARLELFIPVCRAIQHAHQKGIVHRDIKPSNVLVTVQDGVPVPKVIDFGIAKAIEQRLTERTLETQLGSIIGTLEYMSPEQADLGGVDIDTRSDIYALGVLLYELLTGSTPLDRANRRDEGLSEVLRRIREEDPPRPSTRLVESKDAITSISDVRNTDPARLTKLVRGDLDWIVMKAIEKNRARRYESATGLARDIERYLAGDAVEASPPSRGYRLRKFATKNRGAIITAGSFALLLLIGVVASAWQAMRATAAEKRARGEASRALIAESQARAEATRALKAEALASESARQAKSEAAIAKGVNDFLRHDLLEEASPDKNARDKQVTVEEVVRRAAAKIDGKFPDQPLVEASIRITIGGTLNALGKYDEAIPLYEGAWALRRRVLGEDNRETLAAMSGLANACRYAGRFDQSLKLEEQALALLTAKLGANHLDTIMSMNRLAIAYWYAGRAEPSIKMMKQSVALSKAALGMADPHTIDYMGNLASIYRTSGRIDESIALNEQVLEIRKATIGPDHPDTIISMMNLANAYYSAHRNAAAIDLYEKTLVVSKSRLGAKHPETVKCMGNLASAYMVAGLKQQATELFEQTVAIDKAEIGEDHPDTLYIMMNLASAYAVLGRDVDAKNLFEQTLALYKKKLGDDNPDTLLCVFELASFHDMNARYGEAIKLLAKTFPLQAAKLGADHPDTLSSMMVLTHSYVGSGDAVAALKLARELLAIREKTTPADWETSCARSLLGAALAMERKFDAAEPLLVKGCEELRSKSSAMPTPDQRYVKEAGDRVVKFYEDWGKKAEAGAWRKRLDANHDSKGSPTASPHPASATDGTATPKK